MSENSDKAINIDEAREKILMFCSYRDRCRKEVEDKLYEFGMEEADREKLSRELEELNIVDDKRFALLFTSGRSRIKKWGKIKIRYSLKRYGISDSNIKNALDSIPEEQYYNTLKELAEKKEKQIKFKNQYDKNGKLYRYLNGKGYESSLITEVLKELE